MTSVSRKICGTTKQPKRDSFNVRVVVDAARRVTVELRGVWVTRDLHEVDVAQTVHEAVCAERYNGINARLDRLEKIFLSGLGLILVALIGIAWKVAAGA